MRGIGLLALLVLAGASLVAEGTQDSEIRPPADRYQDGEYWKDIRPGRVFICYDADVDVYKATTEELGITNKRVSIVERLNPKLNIIVVSVPGHVEDTKEFIEFVEKEPHVKWAEPDRWIRLSFTPNDTFWTVQYDKPQMNCEDAWDIGLGSMEITAAVIDKGCQYSHEDLAARYGRYVGYDYFDRDDDPTVPTTSQLHGTHCSGILAATINNAMGIAGVANVRLLSYRCGGEGSGLDISACVNSIQESADSGWNILSLSWGSAEYIATVATAVDNAWYAGCLMFAATGNNASSSINYPARDQKVIAVGAINSGGTRPSFSNYGNEMELVAGGVSIASTVPFDDYLCFDGTSMACPNVAGAGALVWSAKLGATNQEIRAILCSTAVDLGPSGWDTEYGYGKPDCYAAIQALPPDTGFLVRAEIDLGRVCQCDILVAFRRGCSVFRAINTGYCDARQWIRRDRHCMGEEHGNGNQET
jgi:thermitase